MELRFPGSEPAFSLRRSERAVVRAPQVKKWTGFTGTWSLGVYHCKTYELDHKDDTLIWKQNHEGKKLIGTLTLKDGWYQVAISKRQVLKTATKKQAADAPTLRRSLCFKVLGMISHNVLSSSNLTE